MEEINDNDIPHSRALLIAELICKSREKLLLSEEEQDLLQTWRKEHASNAVLFDQLHDHAYVADEVQELLKYDEKEAVSSVFQSIGHEPPSTAGTRWRIGARQWLVAASVLVLLASSWWLFVHRKHTGTRQPLAVEDSLDNDNSYKALLTLGDSREVQLDGGKTGFQTTQGKTSVEKKSGTLVYIAGGNETALTNKLTTPRGAQYSVMLTDGTQVWLNAASSITYPTSFPGDKREVTITGEAYFRVAENKTKPFIVSVNKLKVEVVGTEFNVMAYSGEDAIRTTLVKGAVKASVNNEPGKDKEVLLKPGQQAVLSEKSEKLDVSIPDMDEVLGWRSGEYRFHETPVRTIMRQISRWYDVNVEYEGTAGDITLSGQISRKQQLDDLLDILAATRNVHFEKKNKMTVVVKTGKK